MLPPSKSSAPSSPLGFLPNTTAEHPFVLPGTSLEGSPYGPRRRREPAQHMLLTEHKQKFPSLRSLSCSRGPHPPTSLSTVVGSQLSTVANTYQLAGCGLTPGRCSPCPPVVAPGVVVSCILFSRDQLLWMEEVAVSSGPNLIYRERAAIQSYTWFPEKPPSYRTLDTPIY